jgi:N-acetyl-gamma-glutamyl-phosphate reductase
MRGIQTTIFCQLNSTVDEVKLKDIYQSFYRDAPFVRINSNGSLPNIADVVFTNFLDIGFLIDESKQMAIIISCLDNLLKGAASQAVQNLNLMLNIDEKVGLI